MNLRCFAALLAAAAWGAAGVRAAEHNAWPVRVTHADAAGRIETLESAGPLIFRQPAPDGGTISGFRPFYAETRDASGGLSELDVLYPIFSYREHGDWYRWSVFNLFNRSGPLPGTAAASNPMEQAFDVWPFWFSRDTGSPDTSYRGLLPFAGTIKYRFGYDRLSWIAFPFYGQAEKRGAVTTAAPWPFVKVTRGTQHGFAIWPLYGTMDKPGVFHREYYLWPFAWNNTRQPPPDAPAGTPPRREVGVLPFFTRETDAGFVNVSYAWPFFGYTDRTTAPRYHETRYFWPFLVQGHGDNKLVEHWAPFYTHSIVKGLDKRWVLWPIYRRAEWTDARITDTRTQIFYFLYWSEVQHSLTNPQAAPAEMTHLWPLYSYWDNGAGRRQFQFLSPIDVFFPGNPHTRTLWSPLFAVYRFDRRAPGDTRNELLWGLVTWQTNPERHEFHLGPLLSVDERVDGKRVALGHGLVGLQRGAAGSHWRLFWFDFTSKADMVRATSR